MAKRTKAILACLLLVIASGCGDRVNVEDTTMPLVYAFDMTEDHQLMMYQASPNFSKESEKMFQVYGSKVHTNRQGREVFNSTSPGIISPGKLQVLMFSERMLKKQGLMPYLDVIYRDPKNTGTMRIVAVKDSISSVMNSEFTDKPILPLYLTEVIDVGKKYNNTVFTTAQDAHILLFDKGITPAISEIKKEEKGLVVTGSALLNKQGKYVMSLSRRESALLLMLQKKAKMPVVFTVRMPRLSFKKPNVLQDTKGTDYITVNVSDIGHKISVEHKDDRFFFDMKMKCTVVLSERTFDVDMKKEQERLAAVITDQLEKELNGLIKKVQARKLDPFGFGWKARAQQYQYWKKVENNWPKAFSKATVTVTPTVEILTYGVVE